MLLAFTFFGQGFVILIMAESEKDLELLEGGVFMRDMVEGGENPDVAVVRNICLVRRNIRNKFRVPILETTNLLGRKVPEVTHETIMVEEEARLLARARRNLRMGVFGTAIDAYSEALKYRARKDGTEHIYNEEYGKYFASKIIKGWSENGPDDAVKEIKSIDDRPFLSDDIRQNISEELAFTIKEQIIFKIQAGNYKAAVEGILKLAEIVNFSGGDLYDMGLEERQEAGLVNYLEGYLAGLLDKNPIIYEAVGKFFLKVGIKGLEQLHLSDAVRAVARRKLIESAGMGICYLSEAIEVFDDLKIVDAEEVKKWPEILAQLERRLSEAMSVGGAAFMRVRDYIVENGLIKREAAGELPLVIQAYQKKYSPESLSKNPAYSVLQDVFMANNFLENDKQHELNIFNGVRHMYCLELANFLREYPYFQKFFKDFDPGDFLGDGKASHLMFHG